jgi:BirA family biotin operon repressor/biotin-[acetyl-CoA-carboxylase] ligase
MSFLDADEIRAATFVRHIELHDTLGSTNDRAAELALDTNIELPALVVARHQTAGRGRGQNKWWSGEGALTFSLLLEPAAFGSETRTWPQVSLTTATAVCDALRRELDAVNIPQSERSSPATAGNPKLCPCLGIKWPNDVLLDGRKIAGILIESPGGAAPAKDRIIIGIGININNSWQTAPADMTSNGASLCDVTDAKCDLQSVLQCVLAQLHSRLIELAKNDEIAAR